MKHFLSLSMCTVIWTFAFGQKISIATLQTLLNKNYDYVDTKLTSFGYSFESSYDVVDGKAYAYSNSRQKNNFADYAVTFQITDEKCSQIQYQSSYLKIYSLWKAELKLRGFVFSKTEDMENGVKQIYYNKSLKLYLGLFSDIAQNMNGDSGTRYYMTLYH